MTDRQEYLREWRRANRARIAETSKTWRKSVRSEVLEAYGGKCACCGEARNEFLAIDHVNGDGADHREMVTNGRTRHEGGAVVYSWLKRNGYPEGFRVLCHNCNCARGYYGYCPHEKEA